MIFNMGGGSKTQYAVIGVTYPSGDTCTCTNGTTTLTLPDTSGLGIFSIPSAGTWTVSCTTVTTGKAVSITSKGQTAMVKLSTFDGILYDAGDQKTSETGGWSQKFTVEGNQACTAEFNTSSMYLYSSEVQAGGSVGIANKVDLTNWSTLKATFSITGGIPVGVLAVLDDTKTDLSNNCVANVTTDYTAGTYTLSIDISSLNDSYYVGVGFSGFGSTMTITKVWCEA